MNYYNFVNTILETSKSHKLVYEVGEGDIYEHLNSGDHKYPCVFLTVQNVDSNGDQMTVTGSLFYVDALLSDTSNKLQIQSTGMTTLQQIFMRLMDNYPDFDLRTGRYTPFDEKFSDLCAGVFSNFTVSFMDDICIVNDDIFEGDEPYIPEPEGKYITITVLDGDTGETIIHPNITGNLPNMNLQYRINSNGDWSDFIVGTTEDIHLVAGDFVQFKGNNPDGLSAFLNYLNFDISGNPVALSGNVMSLIDGIGETLVIPSDYCFSNLFSGSKVKTVSSDFLPAITLSLKCYSHMFAGCTSLVKAPELPATTLDSTCYEFMFSGCTSLENAPELPATTLAEYCYYWMFDECTSLVNAPSLPATTLAPYCYESMFYGCTSLVTAHELPATTLYEWCYSDMFKGCTKLVKAPELPATTLAKGCYYKMFQGCTSLVNAPELPATTLADSCYGMMFFGSSIATAPALPATTLAEYCYYSMFQGCTSLTTAPALPATTLVGGCYYNMFGGCTSLVNAPALNATTLAGSCYGNMFNGCSSLVKAPELPATTIADSCYSGMFYNCNNLNYVKCLATDITATDALTDWLSGVAPTGTFVKKYGVEYLINSQSGIPEGWTVEEIDAPIPEPKYMTITVLDGTEGTVISPIVKGNISPNLQYRINNGEWNDYVFGQTSAIHVVAGDVVQWKGNNPDGLSTSISNRISFSISGNPVHLSGNVMSLIDSKGETLVIPSKFCFNNLFRDSTIKTVSSDFLPATTLSESCYTAMFSGCTTLENSPELPATTLAKGCYESMFMRCTSLKNAPEFPATTLSYSCYRSMFYGCTALTTAPELPVTTLAVNCYAEMFYKCTSLATAPVLPATKLAASCYRSMFSGCTSLTTAPELPATTIAGSCYDMMFKGCSSLVDAPALPATKLADRCYSSMFEGCTSLTTAPELPATTLDTWCYYNMFSGCTSLVNVPKILPATILADRCYPSMFYNCTSITTAPELPATTLSYDCYASMFSGCTSLTTAPELPATTLTDSCYSGMFYNCNNINYVKCLATDITETDALTDWLSGVAPTGTFVKKYGVEYLTNSPSGIPSGWTVEEIDAPIPPEPNGKYLTMTVDESNSGETTISPTVTGSLPNLNLQYRINNGEWTDFIVGTTADIHVVAGDWVQFKGNNPNGVSTSYNDYLTLAISGNPVALSGNIMSLIDGVGETLVIPNKLCFYYLFYNSAIKTVSSDFLPATTLNEECYRSLFAYCNNLTQAPALPATTLATYCYEEMFSGCTALVNAPELPATTLVDSCYSYMFMYCSSLNYVKCLATDNISTSTILGWLSGVSSTGTFVKPAGVSYPTGEDGIPEGWTIQNI